MRRHSVALGGLWVMLLVVDLSTGTSFWAHWPGLVILTILGLKAAPLFVRGWFNLQYARGSVVLGALVLINIFSWSGHFWVLWPAGGLLAVGLIWRLFVRPR